jgi:serine phosphatase RsbU (regulator of sigma subunit)
MTVGSRKALILGFTLFVFALASVLFVWRMSVWADSPLVGLGYYGAARTDVEVPEFLMFRRKPRAVIVVIPGSPAAQAGIRPDDRIQTINDIPLQDVAKLKELEAGSRPGDLITYQLDRAGNPVTARVKMTSPLESRYLVFGMIVSVFCGLVFLTISLLVYWTKPRSGGAAVFYWTCVVGAAFFLLSGAAQIDASGLGGITPADENYRPALILLVYGLLVIVLTNLLLHLSLIFPKERPIVRKYPAVIVWVHAISLFPIVLVATLLLALSTNRGSFGPPLLLVSLLAAFGAEIVLLRKYRAASSERWRATIINHPFLSLMMVATLTATLGAVLKIVPSSRPVMALLMMGLILVVALLMCAGVIVYSLLSAALLYRSYRESGIEEKRQLRWPLWGTILSLSIIGVLLGAQLIFFNAMPRFAYEHFNLAVAAGVLMRLCYLLIPVSFAFGILKYRLMDIDVIIKKTLVYTAITGIIVAVYLVLVAALGASLVRFTGVRSQTVTVVSTLAIAAVFVPVRNRMQKFVDRRFFRRKYDYPEALRVLTHDIGQAHDLNKVLTTSAEVLQQALQNRFVVVFAEGREPDRLEPVARIGIPDEAASGLAIDKRSLRSAEPLRVIDNGEGRFDARRLPAAIETVMKVKGEILGLAVFGAKLSREGFDEEDLEFLRTANDLLARAIDSLRVRKEQHEFAQALEIQRALLPKEPPVMKGLTITSLWQPARTVGGDYFDLLKFDEARVGVCIGDVAGKGMPAALLMSSLQSAVRAIASSDTTPAELCTKVRKVVCSNLQGGKFVTFFYALIDMEARRLWYVNAGHNPPIMIRADGTVTRLSEGGPAFARLLSGTAYRQGEVSLAAGDRLLLFTDGVSEAVGPDDVEFGEDRIVSMIRRSDTSPAAEVFSAVREFSAGELQDDVTIVSLSVS